MASTEEGTLAWHWVANNKMLAHKRNVRVEVGKTYSAEGPLSLCNNGMHGSIRAIDSLHYASGSIICRVRLYGTTITGDDKLCARHREVLWVADAERTLHEFAVWCAERALLAERAAGREPPQVCWDALECKRRWLDGNATNRELDAAWDAARAAAGAAAWAAAGDAAGAAAGAAAWAAAWAAAGDAAWAAAGDAAWDAARAAQNEELERRLLALAPAQDAAGEGGLVNGTT